MKPLRPTFLLWGASPFFLIAFRVLVVALLCGSPTFSMQNFQAPGKDGVIEGAIRTQGEYNALMALLKKLTSDPTYQEAARKALEAHDTTSDAPLFKGRAALKAYNQAVIASRQAAIQALQQKTEDQNTLEQDRLADLERQQAQEEERRRQAAQLAALEEENRQAAHRRQERSFDPPPTHAPEDLAQAAQEGRSLVNSIGTAAPSDPSMLPGYGGIPNISTENLNEAAHQASQTNEVAKIIRESAATREKYVIDPLTDPMYQAANRIFADSQKGEEIMEEEGAEEAKDEVQTCEESGEETLEAGEEWRILTVPQTKHGLRVHLYSHGWWGGLSRNVITGQKLDGSTTATTAYAAGTTIYEPLPAHLKDRVVKVEFASGYTPPFYVSLTPQGVLSSLTAWSNSWQYLNHVWVPIEVTYRPTDDQVQERIENNCQVLEEKVEQGLCSYEEVVDLEGPETRVINHYPATRDWWRRRKIYRCHYPSKNDCDALRAKGCYQVSSACKQKVGETCVVWEQTYHCPSGRVRGKTYRASLGGAFCLSGDCVDQSYAPNGDFLEVMSQLSALKEMGADLKASGLVFKGQDWRCTRNCLDFRDCCGNGKGWGVSLKLASCSEEEKLLKDLRAKNRCIEVGTYCAEKKLGVCIRKKRTFCCYSTKLAKIVQEQGKSQLGLGFGEPRHPNCQGLTIDQIARLDFSKIDFRALFADLAIATKSPLAEKVTSDLQKDMETRGNVLRIQEKLANTPAPPSPISDSTKMDTSVQGRDRGQF